MIPSVVQGYLKPPQNPDECIFAKTTACLSSDLKRRITPCQYGGDPDCTQCGCMASVGLGAVGDYKVGGVLSLRTIFNGSLKVGGAMRRLRGDETVAGDGRRHERPTRTATETARTRVIGLTAVRP